MPRVLLTRPRDRSESLARDLAAYGWSAAIWPLIEIRPLLTAAPDFGRAQALLFTSARGVEALGAHPAPDLPACCVGPATTAAARAAGFSAVTDAGGDADALVALADARFDPQAGALLHIRGRHAVGDVAARLSAAGFQTREIVAYAAEPASTPPQRILEEIAAKTLHAAAFFSPRTGEIFASLTRPDWAPALARMTGVAISAAAAGPLQDVGFGRIVTAGAPTGGAMRAAICGAA